MPAINSPVTRYSIYTCSRHQTAHRCTTIEGFDELSARPGETPQTSVRPAQTCRPADSDASVPVACGSACSAHSAERDHRLDPRRGIQFEVCPVCEVRLRVLVQQAGCSIARVSIGATTTSDRTSGARRQRRDSQTDLGRGSLLCVCMWAHSRCRTTTFGTVQSTKGQRTDCIGRTKWPET